jgi:AcrR family transcriptional regulator
VRFENRQVPRHRFTDTRDRIEKAAIRLFVEQGVTETSVRDIARAVGLSEGALYRHFVSKEQLVWAVFERHYIAPRRRRTESWRR